jgi:hypothetical protein
LYDVLFSGWPFPIFKGRIQEIVTSGPEIAVVIEVGASGIEKASLRDYPVPKTFSA